MNFIIHTPEYTDSYGGVIALHKLAFVLAINHNVYVTSNYTFKDSLAKCIDISTAKRLSTFDSFLENENHIVIYPETVFGNPLCAKTVIRWILYHPGVNSGDKEYNSNEIIFTYNKLFVKNTKYEEVPILFTLDTKTEKFVNQNIERTTNSYLIKKGSHKYPNINMFLKHIQSGVLVDNYIINKNIDNELVNIFNKSEYFVSYDSASYHSLQAVLCGATSIIIPDEGITKQEFIQRQPLMKYGIAYGIEDIEHAENTKHLVKQHLIDMEKESIVSVNKMIKQVLMEIHQV